MDASISMINDIENFGKANTGVIVKVEYKLENVDWATHDHYEAYFTKHVGI